MVHIDQKSLKHLFDQRMVSEEHQKWMAKLLEFEIKYKVGRENKVADALFRRLQYAALTTIRSCELEGLEEEVQADERLRGIIQGLVLDPEAYQGF